MTLWAMRRRLSTRRSRGKEARRLTSSCSIPLVRNVNNWLVNTANELVPGGVRNVVDDVADVYNAGKSVVDACEDAGKAIVHGLFGWL